MSDRVLVMRINPGQIAAEYTVGLARPHSEESFSDNEFIKLQLAILHSIRSGSAEAFL
jgi:ABC-type nitrate/sulfonate/bicarbonate transport system ATPase subunit